MNSYGPRSKCPVRDTESEKLTVLFQQQQNSSLGCDSRQMRSFEVRETVDIAVASRYFPSNSPGMSPARMQRRGGTRGTIRPGSVGQETASRYSGEKGKRLAAPNSGGLMTGTGHPQHGCLLILLILENRPPLWASTTYMQSLTPDDVNLSNNGIAG